MHTVSEILAEKGGAVIEIDGGATVFEAVKAMVEANVGALLVTDGDGDRRHLHRTRLPPPDRRRGPPLAGHARARGDVVAP